MISIWWLSVMPSLLLGHGNETLLITWTEITVAAVSLSLSLSFLAQGDCRIFLNVIFSQIFPSTLHQLLPQCGVFRGRLRGGSYTLMLLLSPETEYIPSCRHREPWGGCRTPSLDITVCRERRSFSTFLRLQTVTGSHNLRQKDNLNVGRDYFYILPSAAQPTQYLQDPLGSASL